MINQALNEFNNGNYSNSKNILLEILIKNECNSEALEILGVINGIEKNYTKGIQILSKAIYLDPNNSRLLYNRAIIYKEDNKLDLAIADLEASLHIDGKNEEVLNTLGICLKENNNIKKAEFFFLKLLDINPRNIKGLINLGCLSYERKDYLKAIEIFKNVISFEQNSFEAYFNLGESQREINKFRDAVTSFSYAIKIRPNHAISYNHLGVMLYEIGEFENSIMYYEKAIEIDPNYDPAYINLGNSLLKLKIYNGALGQYEKAVSINPNNCKYYYIIGLAYLEIGLLDEAIKNFHKSINIDSQNVDCIYKLSTTLVDKKEYASANLFFKKALAIKEDHPYLIGSYLSFLLSICKWDKYHYYINKISNQLRNNKPVIVPFDSLLIFDDIELQKKAAKNLSLNENYNIDIPFTKFDKTKKIKIGFYSSDLRFHPVTIWLPEQIENLNKDIFELHAFSFSSLQDEMTLRLKKSFDNWHDVESMTDNEIIFMSRNIGINIGIDLNGYTKNHRPKIFSAKVAPIQINHLGYPGTLENKSIKYIISDTNSISEKIKDKIYEKIYYVPCNSTYDRYRQISNIYIERGMYSIPNDYIVFTCQNHCSRINPIVFDVWTNILDQIPNSILWLQNCGSFAKANLLQEANNRGIDSKRLLFLDREIVPSNLEYKRIGKYLATYKLADIFLDTWPYNGGTTVVDALSVGLPVITIEGITPSARMASGALRALELTELIAYNVAEYIDIATNLAKDPVLLSNIKLKVINNKKNTILFDTVSNAKNIENAILNIFNDYNKETALNNS